jgi:DNA topoisomerase-2
MESDYTLLDSKIRFIQLVVDEKIIIFNKKKDFIVKQIFTHNLLQVNGSYDYLLDLKLHTLTLEKIQEYNKKVQGLLESIETLKKAKIEDLWNSELLSLDF